MSDIVLLSQAAVNFRHRALAVGNQQFGETIRATDKHVWLEFSQLVTREREPLPALLNVPAGTGVEDGLILDLNDIDVAHTRPVTGLWTLSTAPDVPGIITILEATGSRLIYSHVVIEALGQREFSLNTDVGLNLQDINPAAHVFLDIRTTSTGVSNPNNTATFDIQFCSGIPIPNITGRNRLTQNGGALDIIPRAASLCTNGRGFGQALEAPVPS